MPLQSTIIIKELWFDDSNVITSVAYEEVFSDSDYAGITSTHKSIVPLEPYALKKDVPEKTITDILKSFGGKSYREGLVSYHHGEIRHQYTRTNSTSVEMNQPAITVDDVDSERDRRVSAGFSYEGSRFQSRPDDRENIAGAAQVALAAMMAGAQPGDLRWHGGDTDFVWIAEDNSLHPMDAQTMFDFGKTAMAHKQHLIFKARTIKDMSPIPNDFKDEPYWV